MNAVESIVHEFQGELRVSSLDVAARLGGEHRAVLQLVNAYVEDLEQFGTVAFEMRPLAGGGNPVRVAHLNEPQATLLVTYMRNTEAVRRFKVELVRQFQAMRQALAPVAPDLSSSQGVLQMAQLFAKTAGELVQAEAHIAVLEPRAAVADAFEQDHGLKPRVFIRKYFPDEKEKSIMDFLYHVKNLLIHDPQGRWSDVQQKRIPGPTHQHPYKAGREFFHLCEEEDRNGKLRLKLRVRRDREHHLVGYLARHGFKTTHDALPVFELGEVA